MATEVTTSWSSGGLGDKHSSGGSCVGVAGEGLPSAYYYTHGALVIRQNADGTIDIKQSSLSVEQDGISNATSDESWGADTWWFHGLYASRSSFTLYDGPSGPSGYGSGVQLWSDGKISHQGQGTGNASSHYSWLSGGSSTGWKRIANSINELEHNQANTEIYIYVGGLIDYSSTPTTNISIQAKRVTLISSGTPGIPSLFDYYPWERHLNNNWMSLNREGGQSTTAGLFRKKNGSWTSCTNRVESNTNNDHGFRYNNGWQKSPKSGQGAI